MWNLFSYNSRKRLDGRSLGGPPNWRYLTVTFVIGVVGFALEIVVKFSFRWRTIGIAVMMLLFLLYSWGRYSEYNAVDTPIQWVALWVFLFLYGGFSSMGLMMIAAQAPIGGDLGGPTLQPIVGFLVGLLIYLLGYIGALMAVDSHHDGERERLRERYGR